MTLKFVTNTKHPNEDKPALTIGNVVDELQTRPDLPFGDPNPAMQKAMRKALLDVPLDRLQAWANFHVGAPKAPSLEAAIRAANAADAPSSRSRGLHELIAEETARARAAAIANDGSVAPPPSLADAIRKARN